MHGSLDVKSVKQFIYIKMQFMNINAMQIACNSNYRSRNLNSAHHSQKSLSCSNVVSYRNGGVTIVYHRIEFVTKISSIVTWNPSHRYCLSPHRICHMDIVYHHIVIVYHRINVVTCSSSHSMTFRTTILKSCREDRARFT